MQKGKPKKLRGGAIYWKCKVHLGGSPPLRVSPSHMDCQPAAHAHAPPATLPAALRSCCAVAVAAWGNGSDWESSDGVSDRVNSYTNPTHPPLHP